MEVLDLEDPMAPERLMERIREAGIPVGILVNNAGFSIFGPFLKKPWHETAIMLAVDGRLRRGQGPAAPFQRSNQF